MPDTIFTTSALYQTNYDAASTEYALAHRTASTGDPDLLGVGEINFVTARSRNVIRNNAVASSADDKYATKLGSIKVNWTSQDGTIHAIMQDLWNEFAENPMLDSYGNLDTWQIACNHERFASGKALTRLHTVISDQRIPLKLQGIPAEYWDISYVGSDKVELNSNGRSTRYGITFKDNKPELYHFFKDGYFGIPNLQNAKDLWKREAIAADDILNCFERKGANQWVGVPMLASCLLDLYALEDLCDATTRQQTNASAVSWIVYNESGSLVRTPVGSVNTLGNSSVDDANRKVIFQAAGGGVHYLATGDKLQQVQSSDIGQNLIPFVAKRVEEIAAALNMPYFTLSGDTAGMDFSSIRAILIEWRSRIEFIHNILTIPLMLKPLAQRFQRYAKLKYKVANAKPNFILPRWYGVDDLKDCQADLLEIASGFTPIEDVWAERGYSRERIEASLQLIKDLGLWEVLMQGSNPAQNNSNPTTATTGS